MVANKSNIVIATAIFVNLAYADNEAGLYRWRDASGKPSFGSICPAGATCEIKLSKGAGRP